MAAYIYHITLDTGHIRHSPRAEVGDEIVLVCRDLIERATADGEPAIPGQAATMTATIAGRCLLVTVWARDDHAPLVTIGIAEHSRCGAPLWRRLHDDQRGSMPSLKTDRDCVPPEPWCAARLEIGIAAHLDEGYWLGDFEHCLAWAWLAMVSAARTAS